jgi:hypothetical protein
VEDVIHAASPRRPPHVSTHPNSRKSTNPPAVLSHLWFRRATCGPGNANGIADLLTDGYCTGLHQAEVCPVDFGATALGPQRIANVRAELHWVFRDLVAGYSIDLSVVNSEPIGEVVVTELCATRGRSIVGSHPCREEGRDPRTAGPVPGRERRRPPRLVTAGHQVGVGVTLTTHRHACACRVSTTRVADLSDKPATVGSCPRRPTRRP